MAASKSYFARSNYRFLPTDQSLVSDTMIFDLDESDVWNSAARSKSPEVRKTGSRIARKPSPAARGGVGTPASLPVNVPDWSKILKNEFRENRRDESDDGDDVEEEEEGNRIPPHEFLARQTAARSRTTAAASVQEGIGRTLKGRDLSRVRNAIWQKTGFED